MQHTEFNYSYKRTYNMKNRIFDTLLWSRPKIQSENCQTILKTATRSAVGAFRLTPCDNLLHKSNKPSFQTQHNIHTQPISQDY